MASPRSAQPIVHGEVAPGFEEVRAEFARNFAERGELGAACAAYVRGRKVFDLWGGRRDERTGAPWERDTLVLVFSTTKGMAAMTFAVAHSRGLFELDEPVARYWPEFAQNGKEQITVRQLLAHQAGLSAVDEPLDARKLADLDGMAEVLARQRPAWTPGSRHGYHGISLGWYQNALMRRIDPERRSLGRFFREEIARPLGIEFYIGLPADFPDERLAAIKDFKKYQLLVRIPFEVLGGNTAGLGMVASLMWPWSLTSRTFLNPKLVTPGDIGNREFRVVESPSSNGIGTARSIAKAYGEFAAGGRALGITPATMRELTAPARTPARGARDAVLKLDTSFSFGFMKPSPTFPYGTSSTTFGTNGAGGSVGFCDPDAGLGFSYVMNRMGFRLYDDPRERALREACYRCLKRS